MRMRRPERIEKAPGRELLSVEHVQLFTGLETHSLTRRDAHLRTGPGIASNAGLARANIEDAKAAQFNALALGQSALQGFEHRVHSGFGLVALQPGPFNYLMNDVLFNQCLPPASGVSFVSVEIFPAIVNAPHLP
jgi:hypothetical protein